MLLCLQLFAYVRVDCVLLLFVCVGVRASSVIMFCCVRCCLCLLVVFVIAGVGFCCSWLCVECACVCCCFAVVCVLVVVVCACCCCL